MANTEYWDQRNNKIFSKVGHWQGGVGVTIEGYSLMNELMENCSLMQITILNATGKLVERHIADWIEVNFMGLSYPDSRIWCNQISAYAADTNTTVVAAASAAILSTDSRAYGGSQTTYSCMTFLQHAFIQYQQGISFVDIIANVKQSNGKPMIVGFARPIDKDDERLQPYEDAQNRLRIPLGEHLSFAKKLSSFLDDNYSLTINSGGYASAFLLDQGFTPNDGYNIKAFAVVGGAVACYRSLTGQTANSFLPMKCNDIEYTGVALRALME